MPSPPSSHAADADLALRVVERDPAGLREFAGRMECIPRFLAVLNKRAGYPVSRDEVGDLAQDVCVLVIRSLPRYEARASLDTWAWHCCRGAMLNRLRSIQRQPRVHSLAEDVVQDDVELMIDADVLESALDELGPPESIVIRMKLDDELRFSDIGGRLGISPNTAKTQYYRGIRWLQERLGARHREEAS